MSRVLRRIAMLLALAVLAGLFWTLVPHGRRAQPNSRLYVYNWADFIGPHTIAEFRRRTGVKVVYDTYDADETMDARLMAGESGYDVVNASGAFFGLEIRAGVYQKLDKSKLPNWRNIDPAALAAIARYDPGNRYAVPYLHSINGFAYNVDMIRARMPNAPVDSLRMLFDPAIVSRFADCGVTFLDSPQDVIELALRYLHLDPASRRPQDFAAAARLLMKVRPFVRMFDSVEYMNGLANRDLCIAMSYSSDYERARSRAASVGVALNLAFTVPREGANLDYSALLIPAGAPDPEAAYRFLNFMLEPRVIADVTNQIYYGNDNLAARPFVDPAILADPAIYPTPGIAARLYPSPEIDTRTERLLTRTWTRIKTGT
ncbi:MAG: extracellular solute-binding protein [Gammaproteobacteria bacterium]|nr:extracellular solute-binding protein [Gammaproteobacteria bacterium]